MLLLGLTGSIATGKSTVSALLSQSPYNLPIIDADLLARKVVEPGTPGYNAIVRHFGPTTPELLLEEQHPNGKGRPLNRPALGRRVFGGDEERQRDRKILNGIVHPAVRREMYKAMVFAYLKGHWAVVLDIPLLFESGWERYCGTILIAAVSDPVIQMKRLLERDPHLTEEDARNRVLSQGDVREKAERAKRRGPGRGVVVWNDGSREDLKRDVDKAIQNIRRSSPVWWGFLLWVCPPLAAAAATISWWKMKKVQSQWEEEKKREKAKL